MSLAVVRRQGLYEDATDEINELIFRIKEDLASLDRQLDSAQVRKNCFGGVLVDVEPRLVSHCVYYF